MPQVNKNNYNNSNKNKKSNTSNSSSDRNSKIWPEENQWTTWTTNENEGGQMTNRRARKIHEQIGKSQWTTRKTKENSGKPRKMKGKPLQTKIQKKFPKRKKNNSPNNFLPLITSKKHKTTRRSMGRGPTTDHDCCRWEEPRGPRWVKVGQAQEDEVGGLPYDLPLESNPGGSPPKVVNPQRNQCFFITLSTFCLPYGFGLILLFVMLVVLHFELFCDMTDFQSQLDELAGFHPSWP